MIIRRITSRKDVSGLIRIHGLAWQEAYADLLPKEVLQQQTVDPSEKEVQQWYNRLQENKDGIFVAVDSKQVVRGFADFRWGETEMKAFVGDNEGEVRAIYVEPDYWGEGIGTALLDRGIKQFRDNVDTVCLEMLSGNEVGQEFYESYGFERTSTSEFKIEETTYPTVVYKLRL